MGFLKRLRYSGRTSRKKLYGSSLDFILGDTSGKFFCCLFYPLKMLLYIYYILFWPSILYRMFVSHEIFECFLDHVVSKHGVQILFFPT